MVARLSLLVFLAPSALLTPGLLPTDSSTQPPKVEPSLARSTTEHLFDGKTLNGWRGDERLWSVEDGAIKGTTVGNKIKANTFLIWEGGEVADFELCFEAKFTPANNSGVQYRSRLLDKDAFRLAGNQCDLHPKPAYLAMLYGERERGIVAQRGQRVVVDAKTGKPRVVGKTNPATKVDVSEWHRYRIVARGQRLLHQVDGVTSIEILDQDPKTSPSGLIGLQLHAGAPMTAWFRDLQLTRLAPVTAEETATAADDSSAPASSSPPDPHWIWHGAPDGERAWFRKSFELDGEATAATLHVTADNHAEVWLNGKRVLENHEWTTPSSGNVKTALRSGTNTLAVAAWNDGGPAAVALSLRTQFENRAEPTTVMTDASWQAAASGVDGDGWHAPDFDDSAWSKPTDLGTVSAAAPWSGRVDFASFSGVATNSFAQATRDETGITTLPGFSAELVYEVPRDSEGSWVSLGTLPDGRLVASDQGGKGLFAITPAAHEVPGSVTTVEKIDVELGGAQGLLWAFGNLYAMVNGKGSGLYRITDKNGDGKLDDVQLLRALKGAGEHGPHAVRLSPDGKALVVCAGNHTMPPEVDASRIPTNWGEDLLLPRQWDARGHARGRMAPGGWIARVSPDGAHWEMLSVGYRNEYDIAFHESGELFTYDADMEWDMGMPWYRPTRICHATSGSEFGWRAGTGKWPVHYPDSLPPVVDIGPGSPTGLNFGYGAKFPAAYQHALYALDWTFGTIWAMHLEPDGATWRATREEFATGQPLPLTDAVVGADGALYFAVGGRGAQSKLYRIRYTGEEDTSPAPAPAPTAQAQLRRSLEAFHGKLDPRAVDVAWPHLASKDRFVAYAARIAIESQPLELWRQRALGEADPVTAQSALLALARQSRGADDRDDVLRALVELPRQFGGRDGVIARLRASEVVLARHGMPGDALRETLIRACDLARWTGDDAIDLGRARLLAYLQSPRVVSQVLPQLLASESSQPPAWAELIERNSRYGGPIRKMLADMPPLRGIDMAFTLRHVEAGWTLEQRRQYFDFINRASRHSGGMSFAGFLGNCRKDALSHCSPAERAACADLTGEVLGKQADFEIKPPQGPGRVWTVDTALAAIEADTSARDFDAGHNLYHAVACASCHGFAGSGGSIGPDLTTVANKFSTRDLLTAIIEPSAAISDQYGSSVVTRKDGTTEFGRAVEQADGGYAVYPMDPTSDPVVIAKDDVASVEESKISQMPMGLTYALSEDELRDLLAYLMSGGNRDAPAFKR